YGGTTAIVLLPHSVIVRAGEPGPSAMAGQHVPAAVNGSPYPSADGDPVANRGRASAFGPTGRHRSDIPPPGVRPGPAAPAQPAGQASRSWIAPAGASGSPAPAPRAPLPDPLRPAPGQEPFRQRFAWNSAGPAAPEPTTEGGSGSSPRGSTPPQTGPAQVRPSPADRTH